MKKSLFFFAFLFIFSLPVSEPAAKKKQGPTEALKTHIDKVLTILKDRRYKEEGKIELQRRKIWGLVQGAFDFTEISKRTLARNWRRFSSEQRERFIRLFTQFLQRTYLSKIREPLQGERIEYTGERIFDHSKAKVQTILYWKDREVPVNYSLVKKDGTWKIYDVQVEGVSLVRNYRKQFREILMREGPEELLERIEKKLGDLSNPMVLRTEKRKGA